MLRVVRELLYTDSKKSGTSIKKALDYLLKVAKRKSVIFLISDFLDDISWSKYFKKIVKKITIIIEDKNSCATVFLSI